MKNCARGDGGFSCRHHRRSLPFTHAIGSTGAGNEARHSPPHGADGEVLPTNSATVCRYGRTNERNGRTDNERRKRDTNPSRRAPPPKTGNKKKTSWVPGHRPAPRGKKKPPPPKGGGGGGGG